MSAAEDSVAKLSKARAQTPLNLLTPASTTGMERYLGPTVARDVVVPFAARSEPELRITRRIVDLIINRLLPLSIVDSTEVSA